MNFIENKQAKKNITSNESNDDKYFFLVYAVYYDVKLY
jgi:hypothetical protein